MATEYVERWALTLVHYSSEWESWLVTAYDANDDQIGDSATTYFKQDAIDLARDYFCSEQCEAVKIYTRDGALQKEIR